MNGRYGGSTGRAVLAFRKVNGFARITSAGRTVFRRLARGGGGFKLRYPKAGKHAEFDWSRQVLVLARGAAPQIILHTSSGKPSTPTVFGKYHFYRKQPGYNSQGHVLLDLLRRRVRDPRLLAGARRIPASHGCMRIPIPSAKRVYGWVSLGDHDLDLPVAARHCGRTSSIAIDTTAIARTGWPPGPRDHRARAGSGP